MPNYYNQAYFEFNRDVDQVELELMSGPTWDLRPGFISMDIYEDIYSNVTQGNIVLDESLNLQELGPLIGGERLFVKFNTHKEQGIKHYEKEFWVYKLEDLNPDVEQHRKNYRLVFATPQFFHNINNRLSITLKGTIETQVSKIARNLLDIDDLKLWESGKHTKKFVVPNWPPFRTINYLCETSTNSRGAANYVFYEDEEKFNLITLETLGRFPAMAKFYFNIPDKNPGDFNIGRIHDINIDKTFDHIQNMRKGMYGSTFYTYDLIDKDYEIRKHDYLANFGNVEHVEDKPMIHGDFQYSEKNKLFFDSDLYYHEFSMDWVRQRAWNFQQMNNFKITVTIPGNTWLFVGDTVDVNVPSSKVGFEEMDDEILSRKYVIAKLRHSITKDTYLNNVELRRDSYDNRADF